MKYLRVTMPDGSKWEVPFEIIAQTRADCYFGLPRASMWKKEFDLGMEHLPVLMDWATNNMNWGEVAKYAELAVPAPPPQINFQDGWVNGKKEVVEK